MKDGIEGHEDIISEQAAKMSGQDDIFSRAIYSTKTAFEVGLIVAVLSTTIGAVLGAFSGFFSGSWPTSYWQK